MLHGELTKRIIGCAMTVYNGIPVGLLLNFGPLRLDFKRKLRELPTRNE